MNRPLPSANTTNKEPGTARKAFRQSTNLGTAAFNKVFPTLGRFINKFDRSNAEQDKLNSLSRITRSSVQAELQLNNEKLSAIFDNQQEQNRLLEQLLVVYNRGQTGSGEDDGFPDLDGIDLDRRRRARAARRSAVRNFGRQALRFLRVGAATAAGTVAVAAAIKGAFAVSDAITPESQKGAQRRSPEEVAQLTERNANIRFTRDVSPYKAGDVAPMNAALREWNVDSSQAVEFINQLLNSRQAEITSEPATVSSTPASPAQQTPTENSEPVRQRGESRRDFNRRVREDQARRLNQSSATPTPAIAPPAPAGEGESAPADDIEVTVTAPKPDTAEKVSTKPAVVPQVVKPVTEQPEESSPIRVEGSSLVYDFDEIVYEADLIEFDGQWPTPVSQPSISPMSSMGSSPHIHVGPAGSGAGVMAAAAGTTPMRVGGDSLSNISLTPGSGAGVMAAAAGTTPMRVGGESLTGASAASPTPQVTGTTAQILATIRQRESGGNYQARSGASSASGAYQFIDGTWRSLTRQFNIGTEFNRAVEAPPAVQDAVAAAYVNQILSRNNGDVSVVPLVWYTGNAQGNMSAAALAANRGLTPQEYQRRWMQTFASMGGSVPTSSAQVASAPPATGPALAQASTARVSADREQTSSTQRMAAEFGQQAAQRSQQPAAQQAQQPSPQGKKSKEVDLSIRILSTFEQLARAS